VSGIYVYFYFSYIALGNLVQAANALGKQSDEECLKLAADIAKIIGQNTFAEHVSEKRENIINSANNDKIEEILKELPTRIEALLTVDKEPNGEVNCNESDAIHNENGEHV
jgi:hypothetical protein